MNMTVQEKGLGEENLKGDSDSVTEKLTWNIIIGFVYYCATFLIILLVGKEGIVKEIYRGTDRQHSNGV